MCWHYNHCQGRSVKGINLLNALYSSSEVSIPVAFEVIRKLIEYCNLQTRQVKRAAEFTKNELMRSIIRTCVCNQLKFKYVLMDSWFAAQENFEFIRKNCKHFIAALKDNQLVVLSQEDRALGQGLRMKKILQGIFEKLRACSKSSMS